jgi:hypothetical protein
MSNTTLKEKIAKAATYVVKSDDPTAFIWQCLNELGIYDDEISLEILNSCKEGDARAVFCEKNSQPVPRFRKIWEIINGETEEEKAHNLDDLKAIVQGNKHIGQYSNKDLLTRFSENPEDTVAEEELRKRSKGGNCIVFDNDVVNVSMSAHYISEASRGRNVPSVLKKDNKIYHVYPVGQFPNKTYDVCPVTGDILFDGYSEKIGISWDAPLECLQFVWLMNDQGMKVDPVLAKTVQDMYIKDDSLDELKLTFIKVGELFDELKSTGDLPSLKAKLDTRSAKKADPFGGNKRR